MNKRETKALITALGGDVAFAKLLGIELGAGAVQRINNWKRRGLPAAVELEHYDTLRRVRAELASIGDRTAMSP